MFGVPVRVDEVERQSYFVQVCRTRPDANDESNDQSFLSPWTDALVDHLPTIGYPGSLVEDLILSGLEG